MRLIADKKYPYSLNYQIGIIDLARWWMCIIFNIIIMYVLQYFILSFYNGMEMEWMSRGVLLSQN